MSVSSRNNDDGYQVVYRYDFDGTLLVVTHDRRLLASLHLTRRLDVAAGTVREVEPVSR